MKKLTYTLLSFFIAAGAWAQNSDFEKLEKEINALIATNAEAEALPKVKQLLDLSQNLHDTLKASALQAMAYMDEVNNDFDAAIKHNLQALSLCQPYAQENLNVYAEAVNLVGKTYMGMGDYENAENYFKKNIQNIKEQADKCYNEYGTALNDLALVYLEKEFFSAAAPLFKEAANVWAKHLGREHPYYCSSLMNLGAAYLYAKNFNASEDAFFEVKLIYEKNKNTESPDYATVVNNLGTLYFRKEDYEKAYQYMKQGLQIDANIYGKETRSYAHTLSNLASVCFQLNRIEESIQAYKEAIDLRKKLLGANHPKTIYSINRFAQDCAEANILQTETLQLCLQSLQNNSPDFIANTDDSLSLALVRKIEKSKFIYPHLLFGSLNTLSNLLEQQSKTDARYIEINYQLLLLVNKLGLEYRNAFIDEADKLQTIQELSSFSEHGIRLAYSLHQTTPKDEYLQQIFSFMEENKSALLSQSLKSQKAHQFGFLPDSLAKKEKELKAVLGELQKAEIEATETEKNAIAVKINATNLDIEHFKQIIKEKFPQYHQYQYSSHTPSLPEIQALLPDKTMLIEYFVHPQAVYLLAINKSKISVQQLPIVVDTLQKNIADLRRSLSDYTFIKEQPEQAFALYTDKASWFYQQLLAPALDENTEHLIVVADGDLSNLPFEAFLTQSVDNKKNIDYKNLPYLLRKYKISYEYAAFLFKENATAPARKNNQQILAFAGDYSGKNDIPVGAYRSPFAIDLRKILAPLPAAQEEVKNLELNLPGLFLYKDQASEANFKQKAHEYAVLHLATHGVLHTQYPILSSIAFSENGDTTEDNFLEAYEISKMQLHADLVVLSACETGYGKFKQGEGTLSLARSFMYAGVPSLVVSLWEVNDASTKQIMNNFYTNLSNNKDKAEALRRSKLDYIENAKGLDAHPAFWSPFVQIGNSRPIALQSKKSNYLFFWFTAAGVLCFMIYGIFKSR